MNFSNFKQLFLIILGGLFVASCGGGNTSRGTGWDINSKKGGFQYNTEFNDQETGPGLVFIEGGTYTKGQVQDDVMHDWKTIRTKTIFDIDIYKWSPSIEARSKESEN